MDGLTGFQVTISVAAGIIFLLGAAWLSLLSWRDPGQPPRRSHRKERGE